MEKIMLKLGLTTGGTLLGHSIKKVENYCPGESEFYTLKDPFYKNANVLKGKS